jgi:uncharacterized lipoprotein YddW (UPF0748 family)
MRHIFIILLLGFYFSLSATSPKCEIRGAWITTAYRLDWPTTLAKDSISAGKQKQELLKLLDKLQFLNFNTVFLQVRMRNDLIYPSKIEPWSAMLTGKSGKYPGYDPLQFAISECHKRGLELHAWMVSIPIGSDRQVKANGEASLVRKHPEMCKRIKGEWFLDPGNPSTAPYLAKLTTEISLNYDIDGLHLDYMRYPEIGEFPDSKTKAIYGKNEELGQWRRENINRIVYAIYDAVKVIKPWVQISSSPIGKHSDLQSISSLGWNGYHKVYQDAKAWLKAGKHDFIAPMMYFKEPIFKPFMSDWKEAAGIRPVVAGVALYMMNEHNWAIATIENEINFTRENNSGGQTYFRTEHLMKNTKLCADKLKTNYYLYPALLPPMLWLDSVAPNAPMLLKVRQENRYLVFEWNANTKKDAQYFNIYSDVKYNINTNNIHNLLACRIASNSYKMEIPDDFKGEMYFTVTANDRFHNESKGSRSIKIRFAK